MSPATKRPRASWMVEAALAPGHERLASAWGEWRRRCPDLEGMDAPEYRLLPFVWRRVERAGLAGDDPDAGRLRGLLRKAWFHNQHLLQEAAVAQETLAGAGIASVLGRECALLAARPDVFGSLSTIAVDLLVSPRDLARGAALLARRRPSRWREAGRVSLRAAGMDPLHLQAVLFDADGGGVRETLHGTKALRLAATEVAVHAWLADLFARNPPVALAPGRWVVDAALALRDGSGGAEAGGRLVSLFEEGGDWPLLAVHARAALAELGDLAPAFVVRAASRAPGPGEDAALAALEAFPAALAGSLRGEAAWWAARRGRDPLAPGLPATLAWMRGRAADLVRNLAADRDYRARVAAAPGRYLLSALDLLARR